MKHANAGIFVVLLLTTASIKGPAMQRLDTETQAASSEIPQGGAPQDSALTNADLINMVQAKVGDELIIAKIKSSPSNFDTSIDAILKLKAAGVSDAVIRAMVDAAPPPKTTPKTTAAEQPPPPDPNDPKSPHDAGIYWLPKEKRDKSMVQLEPSTYSAGKMGGMWKSAMTYGIAKTNWKAVVRNPRATLRMSETLPEFWFYFEEKSHGLSQASAYLGGASSPNEFILAKMEEKSKEREMVVGEFGITGGSTGTRTKDIIEITFVKVAPGVYKVVPSKPLPHGEYCFFFAGANMAMGMTGGKLFDFGVDRAE
jgi:hypothetical protein